MNRVNIRREENRSVSPLLAHSSRVLMRTALHERIVQIAEDALAATYALKGENLDIPKAPHFEDPAS